MISCRRLTVVFLAAVTICSGRVFGGDAKDAAAELFFESKIRPLLLKHCTECHGLEKHKGGLRLDSRVGWQQGGEAGPAIVPEKPEASLLIKAVSYKDSELMMPPKKAGGKLTDAQIADLTEWIKMGAPDPRVAEARAGGAILEKAKTWWAFQPLIKPALPHSVAGPEIPTNPIDFFVNEKLAAAGLEKAPPADRRTLLRRTTFDITGLPPTPAEMAAFLADNSPDAFTKVVDRLLETKGYGQRWARHWLDVARYADYHDADPKGRNAICEPMEAWRYRDWVVESFNRDLPFDQFIVHQIAGDLLPAPKEDPLNQAGQIATTFLVNGVWDRGDADKEKLVSDMVDDQIDTVGKAFLGLTLGCARCHDHKFDPVSNDDYYALAGIFYSSHFVESLGTKGGEITIKRVPLVPRAVATTRDGQLLQIEAVKAKLAALDKVMPKIAADHPERLALLKEQKALEAELPPQYPVALTMQEGGTLGGLFPNIQDVPVHMRGSYTRLGTVIPRRMPAFFAGDAQPKITKGSGRRELADWIASKDNRLTARVIVNRVWQWHFGEALVRTPNNFGLMSEAPSHPALLDWLAAQFIEDGWSLKKLHRRIMLSTVYQQASVVSRAQAEKDPENRWLARFGARRLEAEAIRDAMIFVSGRLDLALGGPAGADVSAPRRALYIQTCRWDRSNFATLFDAANPDTSSEKRHVSTVAPQALLMMNNSFIRDQADHFVKRLLGEVKGDETARIQAAYQILYGRPARVEELEIARQVLKAGKAGPEAAWRELAHVLLCTNEFIYMD